MPLLTAKCSIVSNTMGGGGSLGSYWIQVVGDTTNDVARGVTLYNNEIYFCGTFGTNGGVLKTDLDGNILWCKTYTAGTNYTIAAIEADSSGNLYTAGYDGGVNWVVGKLDNNGSGIWHRYLGETTNSTDRAFGINLNSSDEPVLSGFVTNSSTGTDIAIAKWSTSGVLSYTQQARDFDAEQANRCAINASDYLLVPGYRSISGYNYASMIVFAPSGTATAVKYSLSAGSFAQSQFNAAAVDSNGDYYWMGVVQVFDGTNDLYLLKTNSSGSIIWQRTLEDTGTEIGQSITVDASNNVYVAGYTTSQGQGSNEFVIAKFDSSGTLLWQNVLGSVGNDVNLGYLELDDYDGLVVIGYTGATGSGSNEWLLSRLPTDGTGQGTYSIDGVDYVYQTATFTVGTPTHTLSPWSPTTNSANVVEGSLSVIHASASPIQYITAVT